MKTPSPLKTLFFCLLCIALIIMPASAGNVTITFSDLSLDQSTTLLIYKPDAPAGSTLIGEYNTSASVILEDEEAYLIVLKPSVSDWFEDPISAISFLKLELQTLIGGSVWFVAVLGAIVVIVCALLGWRRK